MNRKQDDQIAWLAYCCWQERGCPLGSPEVDWYIAEKKFVDTRLSKAAQTVGLLAGKVVTIIRSKERLFAGGTTP